ncbi:predicted protein [Coccidioides posadasii str. Silveira]|uniref:Predicted protein n=1 Tax=Coccidioides posadasii (strain RMSCC 757 / Silveira) TaxID=443226 RepID=E9CYI1_COCPS|nr:predicted protein [Coccidioides posadasii str. Silveira]
MVVVREGGREGGRGRGGGGGGGGGGREMKGLGRERVCERKERKVNNHTQNERGKGRLVDGPKRRFITQMGRFGGGENVIKPPLVRIPGQNIQVPEAWGGDWPRVADLVILLQRVTDKPSLKAGGGSVLPGT